MPDSSGREQLYADLSQQTLKPLYGAMFLDLLEPYTHWGWVDADLVFGDLSPLVAAARKFDVVTYPDPVRICADIHCTDNACSVAELCIWAGS